MNNIGEIDLVEDRATLEKTREELALELLWIRQAIDSRKQVSSIMANIYCRWRLSGLLSVVSCNQVKA